MQILLARVLAVILALQPWAFGVFAAPRPKGSTTQSLSSPKQDQTVQEITRSNLQVENANKESFVPPKLTTYLETPKYHTVSNLQSPTTEAPKTNIQARFSRWNE
jgi:hypothetical protein